MSSETQSTENQTTERMDTMTTTTTTENQTIEVIEAIVRRMPAGPLSPRDLLAFTVSRAARAVEQAEIDEETTRDRATHQKWMAKLEAARRHLHNLLRQWAEMAE